MGFQLIHSVKSIQSAVLLGCGLILLSSDSIARGAKPSFYVSPEAFLENIRSAQGLEPYIGYGFSIGFPASEGIIVGIRAAFATPASEFDLVGANGIQQMRLSVYQALCAFRFLELTNVIDLSAFGRLGFMTLSTNERLVSVGGFGSIKVPAQSSQSVILSIGLTASKELVTRLSVFLSPQIVFLSPVQMSSFGYSIGGGMSVGIL